MTQHRVHPAPGGLPAADVTTSGEPLALAEGRAYVQAHRAGGPTADLRPVAIGRPRTVAGPSLMTRRADDIVSAPARWRPRRPGIALAGPGRGAQPG